MKEKDKSPMGLQLWKCASIDGAQIPGDLEISIAAIAMVLYTGS